MMLEEDAKNVLRFMASNGLVANASKTALMLDEAVGGKIITTTCINDAAKLWNGAPDTIKNCVSIYSVKKCIKAYTSTLPL